jgi:hypothetical protein
MYIKRWAIAVFVVLAIGSLSLPSLGTTAQGDICSGLRQVDCKVLTAAVRNLERFTSFQYDFDLSASYSAGEPVGNGTFKFKGSGAFSFDTAQASHLEDQASLLGAVKMSMDIAGSVSVRSELRTYAEQVNTSYVLANSFLYMRDAERAKWVRIKLVDYLPAYGTAPLESMGDLTLTGLMADPAVQKAMAAIPRIKGFIAAKRTRNVPVLEGQQQIEFVYTFDFQTLLRSKAIYPILRAILKESGLDGRWSDAQLADMASQLGASLKGTALKVSYWIGANDQIVHAFILDFTFQYDARVLGEPDQVPIRATVHFAVRFTKVGQQLTISVPGSEFVD